MKHRILMVLLLCAITPVFGACSKKGKEALKKPEAVAPVPGAGNAGESNPGIAEELKKKVLPQYPSATIGSAFEGYKYFTRKEWKEAQSPNGKFYIDFTGWLDPASLDPGVLKDGTSALGLEVKFVIYPSGDFYVGMLSRIEAKADGKLDSYPLPDGARILSSIYANKKITF